MPLINCEINLTLTWRAIMIFLLQLEQQHLQQPLTNTKSYTLVVTLLTLVNKKLLQ